MQGVAARYPYIIVRPPAWKDFDGSIITVPSMTTPPQFAEVVSSYEGCFYKPGDFVIYNVIAPTIVNGTSVAMIAKNPIKDWKRRFYLRMFDSIPKGRITNAEKINQIKNCFMENKPIEIALDYAKDVELRGSFVVAKVDTKPKSKVKLILPFQSSGKSRGEINMATIVAMGPDAAKGWPDGKLRVGARVAVPNIMAGASAVPFAPDGEELRYFQSSIIIAVEDEGQDEVPWIPGPHMSVAKIEYPGYVKKKAEVPGMKGMAESRTEERWFSIEQNMFIPGSPTPMVARVIHSNEGKSTPAIPDGSYIEAWTFFSQDGKVAPDCTYIKNPEDKDDITFMFPTDRAGMIIDPENKGDMAEIPPRLDMSKYQVWNTKRN